MTTYTEMADAVSDIVDEGYSQSLSYVEKLIEDGGYDYGLSMDALVNYAQSSAGYDVCYILAAYSASVRQRDAEKEDMVEKLEHVSGDMFPVTSVEKAAEVTVPVTYNTYKPVTVTVVTRKEQSGTVNGILQYQYDTEEVTYYLPDETRGSDTEITVDAYREVEVTLPVYSNGEITGTETAVYYEADGQETLAPVRETIQYLECTVQPFDNTVITEAFGLDMDAVYDQFSLTYGEAIQNMADALKKTLYGSVGNGQAVPLTDAELIAL